MSRAGVASFGVAALLHGVLLFGVPAWWPAPRPPRSAEGIRLELTLAPAPPLTVTPPRRVLPPRRSERAQPDRAIARQGAPPREAAPGSTRPAPETQERSAAAMTPAPPERAAGSSAAEGAPSAGAAAAVYRAVSEPSYLERVQPVYPPQARRLRQEGVVVLTVYIDAEGSLERVEVTQSSGHRSLDEAALAAERRSRFRPATVGGRPVPCQAEVPYRFELE
jgi:protein TonB